MPAIAPPDSECFEESSFPDWVDSVVTALEDAEDVVVIVDDVLDVDVVLVLAIPFALMSAGGIA